MNKNLRKELGIDDWLELVKEDKNLDSAYISFAQYMDILEKENQKLREQLKEKDEVIDEAIIFIESHSSKEPPYYEFLEFYNKSNLSELLKILQKYKEDNDVN